MASRTTALVLAMSLAAGPAAAATIDVFPGPGALQAAVDAASDGDTLRIHTGTYTEAVNVPKRLRLFVAKDGPVILDSGCMVTAGLSLLADRVTVRGLEVRGATGIAINVENRNRVNILDTVTVETCGTAGYGVSVYQSDRVKVVGNDASGFSDGGVYLGGIALGTSVLAMRNHAHGNVTGLVIENSVSSIRAKGNDLEGNSGAGILLQNSDGIVLSRNTVNANPGSGIELDASSDNNTITANVITNNGTDAVDHGTGNCWKGNTVNPGCP